MIMLRDIGTQRREKSMIILIDTQSLIDIEELRREKGMIMPIDIN